MKKFIISILVFIVVLVGSYFVIDCVMDEKDKKADKQTEEPVEPAEENVELRERLANATVGSLVGVNGFYECDTALENFKFINENNEVEFTAE